MQSPLPFHRMVLCAAVLSSTLGMAQEQGAHALPVSGRIVDENGRLDACTIMVHRDDGQTEQTVQQRNGLFDVELLHDHQYTLEFAKRDTSPNASWWTRTPTSTLLNFGRCLWTWM